MIDIETAEDFMIARLKEVQSLKHVDSYQGEIADLEKKLILPIPAVLVVYGGAQPQMKEDPAGARGPLTVSFSVFVISKNTRGKKEASGDVRKALKSVRECLNGQKIIVGTIERALLWQSEHFVFMNNVGVCGYEQVYKYTDYFQS